MSDETKREYLETIYERYHQGTREEKTAILDEVCKVLSCSRKHAIRRLALPPPSQHMCTQRRAGRPSKYGDPRIMAYLIALWKAANLPCGKRLHAMIPTWLPAYEAHHRDAIDPPLRSLLLSISGATIDRLLAGMHGTVKKRGIATTRPGSLLKHQVTIRTNQWDEHRPGFFEVDSVAHCGTSMAGMFAYTINFVDIATTWGEQGAVWGKGERNVKMVIEEIEGDLPFPMRGFDADGGGEFLNHHLHAYLTHRKHPVEFTRSRAYHSDDNAHIEEKNWTRVRQYLGYGRFDNPAIVALLHTLYRSEWRLLHNFFIPSMKLISKERVGSKIVKHHDQPMTPFQRVLASAHIKPAVKKRLSAQYRTLDPFELHKAVVKQINTILAMATY